MRPLQIAAFVVFILATAAAAWLVLDMPGHPGWHDDLLDPFYLMAAKRQSLPFMLAGAAIATVVALAARTGMARRKRGAAGLWMMLAGTTIILLLVGAEFASRTGRHAPMRYDALAAEVERARLVYLAMSGAAILMFAGICLWLSARFTRKPRETA